MKTQNLTREEKNDDSCRLHEEAGLVVKNNNLYIAPIIPYITIHGA